MADKTLLIYHGILILLLLAFLVIFYQYSQNGRYHYRDTDGLIIDSRNGIVYGFADRKAYKFDYPSGKKIFTPLKLDNLLSK